MWGYDEIDWSEPIVDEDGAPMFLFCTLYSSGKVLMHDGTSSHADVVSEMHDRGVRRLVSLKPDFSGHLWNYKENGEGGPADFETLFGKSVRGTNRRLVNKSPAHTVEQLEDAEQKAGDLWGVF